jgi:hypothetical protein
VPDAQALTSAERQTNKVINSSSSSNSSSLQSMLRKLLLPLLSKVCHMQFCCLNHTSLAAEAWQLVKTAACELLLIGVRLCLQ